jgi:hypothetical protein
MLVVFLQVNCAYGHGIKLKHCHTPEHETALWAEHLSSVLLIRKRPYGPRDANRFSAHSKE